MVCAVLLRNERTTHNHGSGNRITPAAASHSHAAGTAGAEAPPDVGDGVRPGDGAGADGHFKVSFDDLVPLVPSGEDVRAEDFGPALKLVQSLDPAGVGARNLEECLLLQLQTLPAETPERDVAMRIVKGHLPLLANREWARLQHAVGCDEATLHRARSLIRSLDPRPGHRFGAQEARYVVPDVIVKKVRDRWVAVINPASLPRVRLNRA